LEVDYEGTRITATKLNARQAELQRTDKQVVVKEEIEQQIAATQKHLDELKALLQVFE